MPVNTLRLGCLASVLLTTSALAGDVMVHDAWVRAMPPSARALPLYLTLHNGADKPHALVAFSTNDGRVELHQSIQEGEMIRMARLERIEIASNAMLSLAPMGLHGMILEMSRVPEEGETLKLTAHFDDGSESQIEARVKKAVAENAAADQSHAHHH